MHNPDPNPAHEIALKWRGAKSSYRPMRQLADAPLQIVSLCAPELADIALTRRIGQGQPLTGDSAGIGFADAILGIGKANPPA
jgi:hypothetical protein